MTDADDANRAWYEGQHAEAADLPLSACPYPATSVLRSHWVDAWHNSRERRAALAVIRQPAGVET